MKPKPFERLKAQHEEDMTYEVACVCDLHLTLDHSTCKMCSGTGRVTLGRIVEMDRAKRVAK